MKNKYMQKMERKSTSLTEETYSPN